MGIHKDRLRMAEMILAAKGIDNVDLYAELARASEYFAKMGAGMPPTQPIQQGQTMMQQPGTPVEQAPMGGQPENINSLTGEPPMGEQGLTGMV